MKRHMGWFLWLLMALACEAAEIVAWKVPLSRLADNALEIAGVARCKTAPEISPFFKEGDELWDLKAIMPEDGRTKQKLQLVFLVWNAGSGRLVAKGNWADICALNDVLRTDEIPTHCRLTLSLYQVSGDGSPLAVTAKPRAEMAMVVRSGQKAEAAWTHDEIRMTAIACPTIGDGDPVFFMNLNFTATVLDQAEFKVDTALTMQSGKARWVARDFDGSKGLDLKVFAVIESLDGSPLRERVMIQKGGRIVALVPDPNRLLEEPRQVADTGWFARVRVRPRELSEFVSPHSREVDPFAEPAIEERIVFPRVSSVNPPESLRPWLDHEILNAGQWIETIARKCDHPMRAGESFIGYDPISEGLYCHSPDRELVKDVCRLFYYLDGDLPPYVVATLDGNRQIRLLARSGERAKLTRSMNGKTVMRLLEIEPVIAEDDQIVDMRLYYLDEQEPRRTTHLNTAITLSAGEPLELTSGSAGDEKKSSLRMKAEVVREPWAEGE